MRYDDQYHLDQWSKGLVFPKIHEAIFAAIVDHVRGSSFLDIGCCLGLLAQHIKFCGLGSVVGIETDGAAIERGRKAGINVTMYEMRIHPGAFENVAEVARNHHITVMVARRVFSEIFGWSESGMAGFVPFLQTMKAAGVTEVFAQGRQPTRRATNLLPTIKEESAKISEVFPLRWTQGEVSYHAL